MNYTGPIYRPPYEADSLLIQVTVGCAHNKCNFCTMYRDVKFKMDPIEQVEQDLQEARQMYKKVKRVFLVNGDAFVLSASRLKPIAELVIKYFPEVEVITMYASVNNIKGKTDEELKELADLRINDLWVGLESGDEETVKYMNKGFTVEESYKQMERLNKAGIRHIDIIMFGGAGRGKGEMHARACADLINASKPLGIATMTLGAFGDSDLAKDVEAGKFFPADEIEVLEEQKLFLSLIEVDTMYMGVHAINTVSFDARLPIQREFAVKKVEDAMERIGEERLHCVPERYGV